MIALGSNRGCLTTESEMDALTGRCPKCGEDMGRKGYCTSERMKAGMRHFAKVRNEVEEREKK